MITLTTDFGLEDPYVAEMKGTILTININAKIIDITHNIEKFNIRMGSFILASASPYFPNSTIHVAVVDPGVGTKRRAILIQTKDYYFIGPDNGILILAAQAQGIEHVYEISNPKFMLAQVSSTFHGRDIFGPAAAYLDKGIVPEEFGLEIEDPVIPHYTINEQKENSVSGEVLHVDNFGNVITNIYQKNVSKAQNLLIKFHDKSLELPFVRTYAEVKLQDSAALIGSHGFLELSTNQGTFSGKYHINNGDEIEVKVI